MMKWSINLDDPLIENKQFNNGAMFILVYLRFPRSSPRSKFTLSALMIKWTSEQQFISVYLISKVHLERTDDLLAGRPVVPQRVAVEVTFVV